MQPLTLAEWHLNKRFQLFECFSGLIALFLVIVSLLQYLFDAGESEAWMSEQELYMISEERARDEVGAGNMLKKHANTEKTVEDYADVVRQLGDRARQLIDQDHPDKFVSSFPAYLQIKLHHQW